MPFDMKKTPLELADDIIKTLSEAGLTYEQMLEVLALARISYEYMKKEK